MLFYVKFNSKAGLFSSNFLFEHFLRLENAFFSIFDHFWPKIGQNLTIFYPKMAIFCLFLNQNFKNGSLWVFYKGLFLFFFFSAFFRVFWSKSVLLPLTPFDFYGQNVKMAKLGCPLCFNFFFLLEPFLLALGHHFPKFGNSVFP